MQNTVIVGQRSKTVSLAVTFDQNTDTTVHEECSYYQELIPYYPHNLSHITVAKNVPARPDRVEEARHIVNDGLAGRVTVADPVRFHVY